MLKYDANGLIVAIAQDDLSGDVRMVAWMNEAALNKTLETRRATLYSRSRQRLWTKGETSGHVLVVRSIHVDCDADTLLLRVRPQGPSCHTGQPTCFFTEYPASTETPEQPAPHFLAELETEIERRATASTGEKSYTKYLLDRGPAKVGEKLREEAGELAEAISSESKDRVASEAADVLYHLLVGLKLRDVPLRAVLETLAARSGQSGHEEKAGRG